MAYKKVSLAVLLFLSLLSLSKTEAQTVEPINRGELTNYTNSWIGNDGGTQQTHIPHDMLNLFVHPNGTVATICGWDEGGTNVAIFRDGALLSVPEGSGTGGWGRMSGKAVVLDDKYVYQLLTQHGCDGANRDMNQNNLPQFPPCDQSIEWSTIRRYDIETGKGAPFSNGYGYKGDMLLVSVDKRQKLEALAISPSSLLVLVSTQGEAADSIKVYDKETMCLRYSFTIDCKGQAMAVDTQECLWVMTGNQLKRYNGQGREMPQQIVFAPDIVAHSFGIDLKRDRILVANRGKKLNVLIYSNITQQPTPLSMFGTEGGILKKEGKYLQGEAGPLRFGGPTGVGADDQGTIYVASTYLGGGRGASLEAYSSDGKFYWKKEGLIFTATADVDRTNDHLIYSPEKIHRVVKGKSQERIDNLLAVTVDPFLFPNDQRAKKDGPFVTSSFKRTFGGRDFLFVSDMYGGMLAGYRFDKPNYGYIAVPFLTIGNGDPDKNRPITLWVDLNADTKESDDEKLQVKENNQYSMSFFVDHAGNIWRGTRGQGVFFWKITGLNANGIPQYDAPKLYPLPEGFTDAKRIYYDPQTDDLFLAGFSTAYPDGQDTWWAMGSTIVKCARFLERVGKRQTAQERLRPDLTFYIPFGVEDGSAGDHTNAKAFTAEGDYIFVALARYGTITIYDRNNGQYIGQIKPTQSVGQDSGWCDFNYAINAYRRKDGSYLILNEENAFAKIMYYEWKGK